MRLFLFLTVLMLAGAPVLASTCYVPTDYATIQLAIDNMNFGDTIIVMPGTYVENLAIDKMLNIKSDQGCSVTFIDGGSPSNPDEGSVISIVGYQASGTVIDGFTIQNGTGTIDTVDDKGYGGGIYIYQATPVIKNNHILDNHVIMATGNAYGGGIYAELGNPKIFNNIIGDPDHLGAGNSVEGYGTGLHSFGGGICLVSSLAEVTENTIEDNESKTNGYQAGGAGGGIACINASATISDNDVLANRVSATGSFSYNSVGGGLYCNNSSPTISGNDIRGNSSSHSAAGIYCTSDSAPIISFNMVKLNVAGGSAGGISGGSASIRNNEICDNDAGSGSGGVTGGAEIIDNVITGNEAASHAGGVSGCKKVNGNYICFNTAGGNGGGIATTGQSGEYKNNTICWNLADNGGGIICPDNAYSSMIIENNVIKNNTALKGGGGFYVSWGSPKLDSNIFENNTAIETGGGLHFSVSQSTLNNNRIVNNTAGNYGGGMYSISASLIVSNDTICYNNANFAGGGVYAYEDYGTHHYTMANTILWGNTSAQGKEIYLKPGGGLLFDISYSDVDGGMGSVYAEPGVTLTWGSGMIDADPQFAGTDDYHLKYTSPCRDTGDNSAAGVPAMDFEDDPRPTYGIVDMGADEFHVHMWTVSDYNPGDPLTLRVAGAPTTTPVAFFIGTDTWDPPLVWWPYGLWYIKGPMIGPFMLGAIPADGIASLGGTIPTTPPGPYTAYLHGLVGGESTHLCVVNIQ